MIHVGKTVREFRETLRLTQQEMASVLGVTNVHLSNIENNKSFPSQDLIDRFRDKYEVDLYILTWCRDAESGEKIHAALRKPASLLAKAWEERLVDIVKRHQKPETGC
jgi:transcriptional regulator with XRE-family HTH domain